MATADVKYAENCGQENYDLVKDVPGKLLNSQRGGEKGKKSPRLLFRCRSHLKRWALITNVYTSKACVYFGETRTHANYKRLLIVDNSFTAVSPWPFKEQGLQQIKSLPGSNGEKNRRAIVRR